MINAESIVRVLHGTRRGHLGRVVAVNFAAEKVPLSLMRYRVRFDDGETEWYEPAMIEEWVVRNRVSTFPQKFATRSGHGDESTNAA